MRIGVLSQKSGFSKDTIRFYEKMGLIRLMDGCRNRYQFKDYPESVLRRLLAIRQIKEYGFTLQETLNMLVLFEEGVLEPKRGIRYVQRKIDRIQQKIQDMMAVKNKLQEIVDHQCSENCPLGKILNYS
jgi:MerR family copper efflux transcriptional regulator